MGASTKKISTAPAGSDALRGGVIDYLQKQGFGSIGAQSAGPVSVAPWQTSGFDRGQIRDVTGERTASVDSLGGANSAFFQNMMGQLAPAFAQRRAEGLAAGAERAGNLTGSGFANRLGSAVNRSLGDEQAALANYAVQGLQMEMQRQQGDANRMLQAGMANQGADTGFLQALLQGRGQDLSARGQDIGVSTGNRDAFDQMSNANAQRFAGLLGQQAQPYQDAIIQSGGAGALLGPLAQGIGGYLGGQGNGGSRGGDLMGGIGDFLGGIFGGGGGGGAQAAINAGNKTASGVDFGSLGIPGMNLMAPGGMQAGGGLVSTNPLEMYGGGMMNTFGSLNGMVPNTGGQLMGSGMTMGPNGPQLSGFASGENDMLNQMMKSGQLPQILQMLMGQNGMNAMQSGGGGMQGQLGGIMQMLGRSGVLGKFGGPVGAAGQILGGGINAGNIGSVLGGFAGNAIPIPILGPMIGSILGKGVGTGLGKIGGGIKRTLGGLFN